MLLRLPKPVPPVRLALGAEQGGGEEARYGFVQGGLAQVDVGPPGAAAASLSLGPPPLQWTMS